jgi:ketosteroid isomerase-like protein
MNKKLLALPVLLLASACNQAPEQADPSAITSRGEVFEEALNAGDIDRLASLYTEDARLLPPNGEMAFGQDAVRTIFGDMIEAGLTGELTSLEAKVVGDIGYNVGAYQLFAGDELIDKGKYMETWQRGDDGQWRYTNDIWNSDLPVPAPAAADAGMETTHVMILHEVEDGERWLAAWRGEDGRRALFNANGAHHVHTFQSADNPNLTGLVVAATDMDALNAMLASEEGAAAAAADGVDLDNMTMLVEAD